MKCCFSSTSLVIMNGNPTSVFKSSKGLRQGNPLFPYLFVIRIGVSSNLINRIMLGGSSLGYNFRNKGGRYHGFPLAICHFSARTLVIKYLFLSQILLWFEALSRLRINLEKNVLFSMGVLEDIRVGCGIGLQSRFASHNLPRTPFGPPLKTMTVWDKVEQRYRKRLALWKGNFISEGEKLTLIKSAISRLSVYFLSLCQMPRTLERGWEKSKETSFYVCGCWGKGYGDLGRKIHLIGQSVVCLNKDRGVQLSKAFPTQESSTYINTSIPK